MLRSAAGAEDILQETWLRWMKVDVGQVRDERAYLVRITTRRSLDRLRTMRRRKEVFVGPWLPEPLLTAPDAAKDVELAESVSMALMLVLETLPPTERAVFVLREAFDVGVSVGQDRTGRARSVTTVFSPATPDRVAPLSGRTRTCRGRSPRWLFTGEPPEQSREAKQRRVFDTFKRPGGLGAGRPRRRVPVLRQSPRGRHCGPRPVGPVWELAACTHPEG